MTNSEAVDEVLKVLEAFRDLKRQGRDAELEELLRDKSIEWTLHEELRGIATVLMRAWLEEAPSSAAARGLLEEHLAGVGQHGESKRVADGGTPDSLDLKPEKIKAFFDTVASTQRD